VVPAPPQNLRLGFSGSTGGSTNIHEIRNLNIVQVPFANTDVASTPYNQPLTLAVLNNDVAPGSSINPASVDLNPSLAGQQTTFDVPGKGSFSVDNLGVVTFTPSGTYAGTVIVPYTMQSILGADYTSSPANMRITVQGADLAATLKGPAATTPGQRVTFTMETVNQGAVTALSVVPKLQLPVNLPTGTVTPTSGSYDAASGWVTFAPVASLTSGAPAVANGVTYTVPANAPASIASLATVASAVPDPELSNNTASLATSVGGVLPVELTEFTAQAVRNDAQLSWRTASEKNNDRFEVERSLDGTRFEVVGTVRGQGTKSTASSYGFRDADAGSLTRKPIYYRLHQFDADGKSTYGPARAVQFAGKGKLDVSVYPNPNPHGGRATLDLTALPAGSYDVLLTDVQGRVLRQQRLDGAREHALDVQALPAGMYLVRVQGATGAPVVLPFVYN
jgi:hypothetical protein